jgi:pimeloyl-ACP methyl ester carboxylesterase
VRTRPRRRLRSWIRRGLLGLVIGLVALAVIGVIYQAFATEIYRRIYPPPGELVDVGGHSLHINCVGEGSPTVILESGLGATSVDWANIQPEVANTTRVCAYDRAGSGWSEPGPGPGDPQQIAGELHTLLGNAGIGGPYVLVGHSFGGLYVRMYAYQYPNEVEGMVLVDSSHPEQSARTAEAQAASEASSAEEFRATPETSAQVLLSTQSLGDKPLSVITAGEQEPIEPDGLWLELQDELAALSSDSVHRVVEGATHESLLNDQRDAQATSMAVLEVVEAVRNGQPLTQ